ncbi:uncharacterized protein YkwD [Propionicimonas paludicola]|uniref:Uncharacterized protein YkwD n=1 Tax=Propionicimonas paludicola TaxID=185243 RepID=A0A2A9CUC6_9ACTN|nr:uncharacterized protein YkwD [Propionicimonas paludicola]
MLTLRTVCLRSLAAFATAIALMPQLPTAEAASVAPSAALKPAAAKVSTLSSKSGVEPGIVVTVSKASITGKNLATTTSVRFGSTPAKVLSATKTKVTFELPALEAGKYRVSVTTAAGTATGPMYTVRTMESEVLRLTNVARNKARKCGSTKYPSAPALRVDQTLADVAAAHSRDMAERSYFSHTSQSGKSPFDRMRAANYDYRAAGENIGAGFTTPKAVVDAWLASPGHCRILMSRSYTELGVGYATGGYYGTYWTQDFAKPKN